MRLRFKATDDRPYHPLIRPQWADGTVKDVRESEATNLLAWFPYNFSVVEKAAPVEAKKAEPEPESNKAETPPDADKGQRGWRGRRK